MEMEDIKRVITKTVKSINDYEKLIELQGDSCNEDERRIALQHITALLLNSKALFDFEKQFEIDRKFNLHLIANEVALNYLKEQNVQNKEEYQKVVDEFEQNISGLKENEKMAIDTLNEMEKFADTFLEYLA
jgi:hypothetical protein